MIPSIRVFSDPCAYGKCMPFYRLIPDGTFEVCQLDMGTDGETMRQVANVTIEAGTIDLEVISYSVDRERLAKGLPRARHERRRQGLPGGEPDMARMW